MIENKYSLNFLLIPIIFLLFLPTFFFKSLELLTVVFAVLMTMIYPVYLTLVNALYFKNKSPMEFLKNSHLMIFAMIINLTIISLLLIEKFLVDGPEILMIFLFIFVGLICTVLGVISVYIHLTLAKRKKQRTNIKL